MNYKKDSCYYAFCAEVLRYIENNGRCFANTTAQTRFLDKLYFVCGCRCVDDALEISFDDYSRMWDVGIKSLYVLFGEPAFEWRQSTANQTISEKTERNNAIIEDRKSGMTYAEIGKKYRLTGMRIKQICDRAERRKTTVSYAWLRDEIKN